MGKEGVDKGKANDMSSPTEDHLEKGKLITQPSSGGDAKQNLVDGEGKVADTLMCRINSRSVQPGYHVHLMHLNLR